MIERVYMQARKAESLMDVIVATDDSSIEEKVKSFHGKVCLTSREHPSGTDRCAEVTSSIGTPHTSAAGSRLDDGVHCAWWKRGVTVTVGGSIRLEPAEEYAR